MKFVPKRLERTSDISGSPPSIPEILRSAAALVALAVVAYWLLGWLAGVVAVRVSADTERKLAVLVPGLLQGVEADDDPELHHDLRRAQRLVDRMVTLGELRTLDYQVRILDLPAVNALALPGGGIGLTRGLLDEVETEEELAMVLAHELGHFAGRDHLRGLGRGLLLAAAVTVIGQSELAGLTRSLVDIAENTYSRQQEEAADLFGLELVEALYGHAGGATRFFERMDPDRGSSRLAAYFSTHPAPQARLERLERLIVERGYAVEAEQDW